MKNIFRQLFKESMEFKLQFCKICKQKFGKTSVFLFHSTIIFYCLLIFIDFDRLNLIIVSYLSRYYGIVTILLSGNFIFQNP